jgi:hypothetical protein
MSEKKHLYEAEVMSLPPLRLVLGDVPVPDPAGLRKIDHKQQKLEHTMEGTVQRLIAHLKDEK